MAIDLHANRARLDALNRHRDALLVASYRAGGHVLYRGQERDDGREAIDTLVKRMEDHRTGWS